MRTIKILFYLTLYSGLLILASGIYFKLSDNAIEGLLFSKMGNPQEMLLDGDGLIIIGCIVLLLCVSTVFVKKEREKEQLHLEREIEFISIRKKKKRKKKKVR